MMKGLSLATCDRALAPGAAPEWVHLFPLGRMMGRDGRAFDLANPTAVMQDFRARGVDLPVDFEHQNDRPEAKLNGPVPAAGWIKELKADGQGLWGRVEWTATASEMIGNREYRYLSPSFQYEKDTNAIVRLNGAGLVHNPNLHLTALASQDTEMDTALPPAQNSDSTFRIQLAKAMGLGPDATTEQMLSLVARMMAMMAKATGKPDTDKATMAELMTAITTPDPAKYVPVATVQAMLAERNATLATMSDTRASEKVKDATRKGYLSPAMTEWATALCTSNEASFDAFIAKAVPQFAHLPHEMKHLSGSPPGVSAADRAGSEVADAICAQLGLAPGALKD